MADLFIGSGHCAVSMPPRDVLADLRKAPDVNAGPAGDIYGFSVYVPSIPRIFARRGVRVARVPLLSDEVEETCGGGGTPNQYAHRAPRTVSVYDHYREILNSKIPATDPDPFGFVQQIFMSSPRPFEVRWEPTNLAYTVGGGSGYRYGQTQVRVFPGTFWRGADMAKWGGSTGVSVGTGVFGLYLEYPPDFWPHDDDPDFADFVVRAIREDVLAGAGDPDDPCGTPRPTPLVDGNTMLRLATVGDGVGGAGAQLELSRGIQHDTVVSVLGLPPADANYKVPLWDQTGWTGGRPGRWVPDYPRLI